MRTADHRRARRRRRETGRRPRGGRAGLLALVTAAAGAVAGTGVSGAAAGAVCPGADSPPDAITAAQFEAATVCLVNQERAARGLAALARDARLDRAAGAHAADMAARGYFSHTGADGASPGDRAKRAGYAERVRENLHRGSSQTPSTVVARWMGSGQHRPNILDSGHRSIGAARTAPYLAHLFGTAARQSASGPGGEGSAGAGTFPAKLEVLRGGLNDGTLDVLAGMTARADGDTVRVRFMANGRRYSFTERVRDGEVRIRRRLPRAQRRASTGIVEIDYAGNDRVRPASVRLRAANGKALLRRTSLSLRDGVMSAEGTVSSRTRGLVRLALITQGGVWKATTRIEDGRWTLREQLPDSARAGGYLTIQYTGYLPRRIRGEQIAKELLAGQSFG